MKKFLILLAAVMLILPTSITYATDVSSFYQIGGRYLAKNAP